MKKINSYILEKLIIHKDIELEERNSKTRSDKASDGAVIDVDFSKEVQLMTYDPNSGILQCYEFDDWRDLVKQYSYEPGEAKRICNLNKGESYLDKQSGGIYTRLN